MLVSMSDTTPDSPKPVLAFDEVHYYKVDYHALDSFIDEAYGIQGFSCAAVQEWGNDSQHRVSVDGGMNAWDQQNVEKVKRGEDPNYCLRAVMNDLCAKGYIKPGTYLIDVCW